MSVSIKFRQFCDNLKISNRATISARYTKITRRLNSDMWNTVSDTSHSLYVGSYGRNTGIDGISDVDMLFELPASLYTRFDNHSGNGQSALLQHVKASISNTYSVTNIKADGQIIQVPFTDGITFEVLPVFLNNAGTYTHADTNEGGKWRVTNPRAEVQAMRDRDSACNKNLKRLCRMMRAWKNYCSVPISSFLIDTLAYRFIDDWESKDKSYVYYDWMCRDFFLFLAERSSTQQ